MHQPDSSGLEDSVSEPEKSAVAGQSLVIPPDAQLAILVILTAGGQVSVAGTIDSKVAALGLLEVAKGAISQHVDELAKGKQIIAPSPGLSHLLKFGNGRS
jgi:hypothetical protein